jgi:hypothetical protein
MPPHEIRNINRTNAVIFRSVTVEATLAGHDSCHLKCNYFPQAAVALVMYIHLNFTLKNVCKNGALPSIFVTTELLQYTDIVHLNPSV